jgi:hypothetical protein
MDLGMDLSQAGRSLIVLGVVIAALGLALAFADRVPLLGRLPGDIRLGGDNWTVYVPIGTSIVLSVLLTIALSLVGWLGGRQ